MQGQSRTKILPCKNYPALLVFSALLLVSACSKEADGQQGSAPPPEVSVAEIVVRDITSWKEFIGRVEAKEVVQIRPRITGVIEAVKYREGDIVKKNDLLFVINKLPFRVELNRAEADLARARAQAKLTQAETLRAKNLVKRNLLSQDEYDQRVAAKDQAIANVRSTEATVKLARLNLSYTDVRSPINGRSGRALVTNGNLVSSSLASTPDLLTTVLSVDPVYVVFDSDELTYLEFFSNSSPSGSTQEVIQRKVYIGLANEEGFPREGYVDFIDNRLSSGTGTISMRAVLENKDHQLTPGLFARVKLLASKPIQAMLINEQAILTDQDRQYVYIINEKNQAIRRNIHVGATSDGLRIITEGLKSGDQVIVYGIQKVFFPGMQVAPKVIAMNDPPAQTAATQH